MTRKLFTLVRQGSNLTVVYVKGSPDHCAHLYLQSDNGGHRFRLANYPHRMSKLFTTEKSALKAIEGEVL